MLGPHDDPQPDLRAPPAPEPAWAEWMTPATELDPSRVLGLERRIARVRAAGERRVVLDFVPVLPMDTHTLSVLCAALRRVTRTGVAVVVVGAPPRLRRVLETCAIEDLRIGLPAARPGRHLRAVR